MKAGRTALDPISLTTYWNKLQAIVDESTATLLRTAFSRIVTDAWDFSCVLFDERGEMIVQGRHGMPSFIGCLALAMKDFLRVYPPEDLEPGDSLVTTDPWIGASQVNDVFFITPIFHHDRVVGYAGCVSHSPDMGGRLLSADSREVFEEGFRMPIVKLFRGGKPNEDLFRIIRLNVRVPDIVVGDLFAQLAANEITARRLAEFMEEKHLDDLVELSTEISARSEAAMRRALTTIPEGTYRGELETDGFDEPITLRCAVTIAGGEAKVDFTGTSSQNDFGLNCVWRFAYADVVHAIICTARPEAPVNGAMLRPIQFFAPAETVVNPAYPAAVGGRSLIAMFLQALIFQTLGTAVPDRVLADSGSPPTNCAFAGTGRDGRRYVDIMFINGGLGARPAMDGVSILGWPANCSGTPVEVTENEKPIMFLRKEFIEDSGGAGRYRGGLGQYFVWQSQAPEDIAVSMRMDRVKHPPLGLFGGRAGTPAMAMVNDRAIHPKKSVHLKSGDVFYVQSASAGGYGNPLEREPDAVLNDVLDGYVTVDRARTDYRVVIDRSRGRVDRDQTERLRKES
jgi:N-methylhydantoinase B